MGNTYFYRDPRGNYHFFRPWDNGNGSLDVEATNPDRLAIIMANSRSVFSQGYEPEMGVPQGAVEGSVPLTDSQLDDVLTLLNSELGLSNRIRRGISRLSYKLSRSDIEY